jgi:hypothetical protein
METSTTQVVLSSIIPVITLILGYIMSQWQYFSKKEHESITKRYIDEGLDIITSHVDHTLSIYKNNWSSCLFYLKSFRESKDISKIESPKIQKLPVELFEMWRLYRFIDLIDDNVCFQIQQSLLAFSYTANNFFSHEMLYAIDSISKNDANNDNNIKEELIKACEDKLIELDNESNYYYKFLGQLHQIGSILVLTKKLKIKNISKLKEDIRIKNIVDEMNEDLKSLTNHCT